MDLTINIIMAASIFWLLYDNWLLRRQLDRMLIAIADLEAEYEINDKVKKSVKVQFTFDEDSPSSLENMTEDDSTHTPPRVTCPHCHGQKQFKRELTPPWVDEPQYETWDCPTCQGAGDVDALQAAIYKARGGPAKPPTQGFA